MQLAHIADAKSFVEMDHPKVMVDLGLRFDGLDNLTLSGECAAITIRSRSTYLFLGSLNELKEINESLRCPCLLNLRFRRVV